jgi:hypothetical protein
VGEIAKIKSRIETKHVIAAYDGVYNINIEPEHCMLKVHPFMLGDKVAFYFSSSPAPDRLEQLLSGLNNYTLSLSQVPDLVDQWNQLSMGRRSMQEFPRFRRGESKVIIQFEDAAIHAEDLFSFKNLKTGVQTRIS